MAISRLAWFDLLSANLGPKGPVGIMEKGHGNYRDTGKENGNIGIMGKKFIGIMEKNMETNL